MKPPRVVAAAFLMMLVAGGLALGRVDGSRHSTVASIGTVVPPLSAATIDGRSWSSAPYGSRRWLIVYVNERCGHCHGQLAAWQRAAAGTRMRLADLPMVVVSRRTYPSSTGPRLPDAFPHERVLDRNGSIANAFGITLVPTTIVIAGSRIEAVFEGPVSPANVRRGAVPRDTR